MWRPVMSSCRDKKWEQAVCTHWIFRNVWPGENHKSKAGKTTNTVLTLVSACYLKKKKKKLIHFQRSQNFRFKVSHTTWERTVMFEQWLQRDRCEPLYAMTESKSACSEKVRTVWSPAGSSLTQHRRSDAKYSSLDWARFKSSLRTL